MIRKHDSARKHTKNLSKRVQSEKTEMTHNIFLDLFSIKIILGHQFSL